MSSVTIVFRKDKINSKGVAPIHFRLIKNRKVSYIASGHSVHVDDWDEVNKKIKVSKRPDLDKHTIRSINAQIFDRFNELQRDILELDIQHRHITTRQLKEKVIGKAPEPFYPFAEMYAERINIEGRIGTYDRVRTVLSKMRSYRPELYFSEITPVFLKEYETHLTQLGNRINTIHSNFKIIRAIFNEAFRQGLVEFESNPFLRYKMKTEKTTRVYLTEEELKRFEEVPVTPGTRLELHKDMFIFSCYTGGLRISDILQLQWQHFDGTHINFKVKKTNSQIVIKVPTKGLEIFEKYRVKGLKPTDFIFDMLPSTIYRQSAKELDQALSSATAYIDKNLKLLQEKAGIEKKISFHTSRHTWATRALRKGVSIDKVSKLMGHAAIKETQVYAKIVNEELDKAMDVFND